MVVRKYHKWYPLVKAKYCNFYPKQAFIKFTNRSAFDLFVSHITRVSFLVKPLSYHKIFVQESKEVVEAFWKV
ncbi:hypothetical protein [Nostoc sp.]|uniref:hypothetical protein n=1 Tax=Nostoc sp. TaxID=1180 RepID=UPI002FF6BE45